MSIKIKITEEEILGIPNDVELGGYVRKKYLSFKNRQQDDEPEHCVVCGKVSGYLKSTHIDLRVGFVEGVGQLCHECNK